LSLRRTPIYQRHVEAGARLVEFAGWEMPVQYEGIIAEHTMVRERAGLFDVSHMGQIEVRGAEALARLQWMTANDVAALEDGRAQYSLLLLPDGGIVDDIIIYRRAADCYLVCVNAANRDDDFAYMSEHAGAAEVVDRSDELALLALQGPRATALMAEITGLELDPVRSFGFVEGSVAGHACLLARTGYTGEDGWEVYCPADAGAAIWELILERGKAQGVGPAGLGARDTLRLEAALPLYGHELDRETLPYEARLGWVVALEKGDFVAAEALARAKREGPRRKLAGIEVPKGGVPRQGYAVRCDGREVGALTSGTRSPTLGSGIALGYLEPALARAGTEVAVVIRDREIAGRVVPLPFYRRSA
jgi:aminomethyltransferase